MQTTTLRQLVTTPGPFTSVYFEDSHDTEDADKQLELRRRDLRDQLTALHAPWESVDALEAAVREASPEVGRSGRIKYVVASVDQVNASVVACDEHGRRAVHEALPKRLRDVTHEVTHEDVASELVLTTKQRDPGDATVFTGESPRQVTVTEPELRTLGATESHERRADEAVPVAAIAVDADLVYVDSALTDGFGALLRHG